jgi:hypothetical protein
MTEPMPESPSQRAGPRCCAARAAGRAVVVTAVLVGLTTTIDGCFLRKWVYRPVLVANAIGDSTTTLSGTRLHIYRSDDYEVYGPTATSVSIAAQQLDRAYREFAKNFGVQGPRMVAVIADSAFAIAPTDAGGFAKRRLHTFIYVRPHNLRDIEGVSPDMSEDEIWPVSARVARELLTAYVAARRHVTQEVETASHPSDYHSDPLPLWYVDAVVAFLSDPGAPDRVMDYLRDHLGDVPPVATLLDMTPPAAGTVDTIGASRERRTVVGAEGVGLALFLVEREGPRIIGRLADSFLAGGTARDVLRDAKHIPQNDRELERVWRSWVRDEYGR